MTGKKLLLPLLAASVMAVSAVPAHAVTWGGDVFGAFSTHTMKDWNDAIDASNSGGTDFNNVNNSFGGGLGLRLMPNQNWMIEGTWEPLYPSTEDNNTSGDKLSFTANSFQGTATYFFPSQGKNKFGLGAGVGMYSMSGKAESAGSPSVDLGGSTVGFHVLGTGEMAVSPGFGLFGSAGYRMAKIDDTEIAGMDAAERGGPKVATDFSGFMVRAGLAFSMPNSSSSH
jgi:hypothetical protein